MMQYSRACGCHDFLDRGLLLTYIITRKIMVNLRYRRTGFSAARCNFDISVCLMNAI
jgi:hypothetical protein